MKYQHQEIAQLWDAIKDYRNLFAGEYTGLTEVEFEMSIDKFRERHNNRCEEAVRRGVETIVTINIEDALQILSSADIGCHHLSCAADTGFSDNSALCIHYVYPGDNKFYALAIPGINYIPTEETLAQLQESYFQSRG